MFPLDHISSQGKGNNCISCLEKPHRIIIAYRFVLFTEDLWITDNTTLSYFWILLLHIFTTLFGSYWYLSSSFSTSLHSRYPPHCRRNTTSPRLTFLPLFILLQLLNSDVSVFSPRHTSHLNEWIIRQIIKQKTRMWK